MDPKYVQVGAQEHLYCKTGQTLKFDDSTTFFMFFLGFGRPGERLGRRLEPLGRAFGRQFGSSEAKLDGQVRPKAAQRAQDGTPDRPRAAQEHRTARQARPKRRPRGQAERSKGQYRAQLGEKKALQSLRAPEIRSDLAEL